MTPTGCFYELLKISIIIASLIMAYAEFAQAAIYKRSWVKWGLGMVALYWAAYYAYSLIRTFLDLRWPAHQIFVRSGILLTVSLVAAGAMMTLRELRRLNK